MAALVACNPYPRESQRMAEAFEQAQQVYGDGENDTLLFIPELDKTSVYYAGKKNYNKAALAALYCGYSEKNYDKQAAMEAFKEAALYGELVHDSLTVARANYQMGKLLYYDCLTEGAIKILEKSEKFFNKNFSERSLTLNMIACCYMLCQNLDTASFFLDKSLIFAKQGNSKEAILKIMNNYAVLYHLRGENEKSISFLRLIEVENNQQRVLNYLNLGNVFMSSGMNDSAAHYFNRMESLLSEPGINEETKSSAFASLSLFAEKQKDYSKALEYEKEHLQHIVSVKDRIAKENYLRIKQQFDYENLRNEMNEVIIARQRIIFILGLVVFIVLFVFILSQIRLARIRKREIKAKERTLFYVRQYTNLLSKHGKTMQKLAIVMDHKNDKALLENLRATVFGNKDSWEALIDVFDTLYPDERERISHQYPELTDIEQKHVILSYFDVSRQDEALLLNTSIHSVDKIRQSVNKKTQNKENK